METKTDSRLKDKPAQKAVTDSELIRDYVDNKSTPAFETLVRRHYNVVHKRLLRLTQNSADADDLSQKLWMKILEHLPKYNDQQKFPNFLNTVATNLLKDEWRKSATRKQSSLDEMVDAGTEGNALMIDEQDIPEQIASRNEVNHLVRELIPQLSTKLRTAFLLRHESEYWDEKQPFQWQHLGELNRISAEEAGKTFIDARDILMTQSTELNDSQKLILLIWTQAQRYDKSNIQTESYLAELLGIPVNTFKTRYRAAIAELTSGLEKWRNKYAS